MLANDNLKHKETLAKKNGAGREGQTDGCQRQAET